MLYYSDFGEMVSCLALLIPVALALALVERIRGAKAAARDPERVAASGCRSSRGVCLFRHGNRRGASCSWIAGMDRMIDMRGHEQGDGGGEGGEGDERVSA
jgi:hypothetical protein